MTETQLIAVLRRAKFKAVKGGKPIPSKNVTAEELEAANEMKAIVVWPRGIRKPPVVYPITSTDEETRDVQTYFEKPKGENHEEKN